MDPATAAAAANYAVDGVSTLMDFVNSCKDSSVNSLSEYTKKTLISSRVYIEDVISGEPMTLDLIQLLSQVYCAMVLSTLNLNELVQGNRTVSQLLAPVSTEAFTSILDSIKEEFGDKNVSVKDLGAVEANNSTPSVGQLNSKEIKIETDPSRLFVGRLQEVTLGRGDSKATVYFLVQLNPYIVPSIVMEEFLKLHTDPAKALRKAQLKAGEIKFWRDYIFEVDRIQKRKKALRVDKDGILREMEDHRSSSWLKSICNFFKAKSNEQRNIANTIVIVSKSKLDQVSRELGLNMKNFGDRQKLMSGTYSLMLVAYDPSYETIDLYMNGIANRGEYSAQAIKSFKKKDDEVDMKQLLALISAGSAPKF